MNPFDNLIAVATYSNYSTCFIKEQADKHNKLQKESMWMCGARDGKDILNLSRVNDVVYLFTRTGTENTVQRLPGEHSAGKRELIKRLFRAKYN